MLKTYSREELKQLEGKRVRAVIEFEKSNCKTIYEAILSYNGKYIGIGALTIGESTMSGYQFELLENEFEVGEEVEVRDNLTTGRNKGYYVTTLPEDCKFRYVVKDYEDGINPYIYEYIRKIQPKPEPKKMTMEELNKELGYEVEIVEKK